MRHETARQSLNAAIADTNRELAGCWAWRDTDGDEWMPIDGTHRTEQAAREALAAEFGDWSDAFSVVVDRVSV